MEEKKDFDIIFRLYYRELLFFVMQFLHDEEESRDVVSDVFEDFWTHFEQIEKSKAKHFLFKTARFKALDRLRRDSVKRKYVKLYSSITERYEHFEDEEYLLKKEEIVERILNELTPPTKEIFISCYVHYQEYREVAEKMGISVNTVKKHVMKALKLIREKRKNLDI